MKSVETPAFVQIAVQLLDCWQVVPVFRILVTHLLNLGVSEIAPR